MSNAKGNFILRLVKGEPNKTKGIKYRIINDKLKLSLAKTKGYISPSDLNTWSKSGWHIETDDVTRAKTMLREISEGKLLIDVKDTTN